MDPHTTEGKQDGLLSQQISEKNEGSCVSTGFATSQLCGFGLVNVPVITAFETVDCLEPGWALSFSCSVTGSF